MGFVGYIRKVIGFSDADVEREVRRFHRNMSSMHEQDAALDRLNSKLLELEKEVVLQGSKQVTSIPSNVSGEHALHEVQKHVRQSNADIDTQKST